MPQLVATGPNPVERLEFDLTEGETVRFGRKSPNGWSIPWDKQISREHADLKWAGGQLVVSCLDAAHNTIYLADGDDGAARGLEYGHSPSLRDTGCKRPFFRTASMTSQR